MNEFRSLVYWGAGNIGRNCLNLYPHIRPQFFIDSNWGGDTVEGIPVRNPNDIEVWDELFIVITTIALDDIAAILKCKGLDKNRDYVSYGEFFSGVKETLSESLRKVFEFMKRNPEYEKAILISAPVFSSRESNNMIRFFREYGIKRQPQKCILFTNLSFVDQAEAQNIMGYPVFNLPQICCWKGNLIESDDIDKNDLIHGDLLTEDEKQWIVELESRKLYQDKDFSYKVTTEIYWYYKQLISILKSSKLLIWGGWMRESYILADIAQRLNVPHGFMEHGWIQGTIQFDKRGISGQSEYAVDPNEILERCIKDSSADMKAIKNYIITNKIDTGKFRKIEEDEISIRKIDVTKKTVFFVGMGDYSMGINPRSVYWEKYVSSLFSSTKDAILYVAEICKRNGWNFVFKPHPNPANQDELDKEILSSNIIQVKYTEIDRLIQLADVVVSIASAVDYKALIYEKPLVQLGHTTLYKKGCSYEVECKDMIEGQLMTAMDKGMTKEQNENFELHMARLLENYLWDDLSDRELRYGLSLDTDFFDAEVEE